MEGGEVVQLGSGERFPLVGGGIEADAVAGLVGDLIVMLPGWQITVAYDCGERQLHVSTSSVGLNDQQLRGLLAYAERKALELEVTSYEVRLKAKRG